MALDSITYQIRIANGDGSYYYPPKAKAYETPLEDLMDESTKRSARGILNVSRVGTFADITLEVGILDSNQMSELLQKLRQLPILVDFYDPELGNYRTNLRMYAKKKSPKMLQQNPILYEPMSFTLTAYDPLDTRY